jgi:hypothetical protein
MTRCGVVEFREVSLVLGWVSVIIFLRGGIIDLKNHMVGVAGPVDGTVVRGFCLLHLGVDDCEILFWFQLQFAV